MGKFTLAAVLGGGSLIMILWFIFVIPELTNPVEVFEVSAENIGEIKIADEVGLPLSDPIKMVFVWNGNIVEQNGNLLNMQTTYSYKDILTDEILWEVILDETVEKHTRKYVDKPGYFMFPNDLEKKNYQVYDVGGTVMNYDFIGVKEIDGLEVYEFSGKTTFDISDVYPDFGQQIFEDYSATNFIEPETGIEVSFIEEFTDYAIVDGQKIPILEAWDGPSEFSQKILIQKAQTQKIIHEFYHQIIPIVILIGTFSSTVFVIARSKYQTKEKEIVELKQVETRKDEFSSMIAHELKTPLVPIKSYLDMIISGKIGQLTPQQIEKLEIVRSSADSLNKLIDDLSDVQKLDTGNMKIHLEDNSLSEIINETVIKLEPDFNKKGIKVNSELHQVRCLCDKSRISQILLNLLTNAIDFTPSSDGKITISLSKENDFAKLSVEDNGSGIPDDKLEQIFQKYYQVDSSMRREYGGTGLGLSITKGIVDMHGGKINVESEMGKFTRFTIFLPLTPKNSQSFDISKIKS
jgi:signal transduction histidine kinase